MTDAEKEQALREIEEEEIVEELQKLLEQFPEAIYEVFGLKQPFDSNTRPFDIFQYKSGSWGVVLERGPGDHTKTVGPFATREDALAFVAEHAPKNS